jgi:hypothetical protein
VKQISVGLVFLLSLGVGVVLGQQVAPAAPATAAAAQFTADERVMLESVDALRAIANTACQSLEAFQRYQQAVTKTTARIEANHPGLTIAWDKGALVAKAPPPKP